MVDPARIRTLKEGVAGHGPVVYWMQRDMRAHHNWALLYAQEVAIEKKVPLIVVFNKVKSFLHAGSAHYTFMLEGLREVSTTLAQLNIPVCLCEGDPEDTLPAFIKEVEASVLVTDFSPLRIAVRWKKSVAKHITIPFMEVDAHNIIPCWVASDKEEFAAYTFRPKVRAQYRLFAGKVGKTKAHAYTYAQRLPLYTYTKDVDASSYTWITPGSISAHKAMRRFITHVLPVYDINRNDPTIEGQSNLSPYLHFGHLSAQQLAYEVEESSASQENKKAFLEELVVRRELSDNFCFYQEQYDSYEGLKDWAKKSLAEHETDTREFIYTKEEFQKAQTHDRLWNAAQLQMVKTGKMHGYMRMYWAKKILEWTKTPQEAIAIAVTLNDAYSLDGRDPNGYAGVLWSIGGLHDRAWFERPVFGKIRYMNYNGCKRKFDVEGYITAVDAL